VPTRFQLFTALATCLLTACAEAGVADEPSPQRLSVLGNAEVAAQSVLRHTLAYHSAVHTTYQQERLIEEQRGALQ
jgi:hypothetical protein